MDLSSLSKITGAKAAGLVSLGAAAPRWRPGLSRDGLSRDGARAQYSEVFAPADEAGGVACALALALDGLCASGQAGGQAADQGVLDSRHVLWVQDMASIRQTGRPYRPGMPPVLRDRVIHVAARHAADALFALEEGLGCRDLACVIGEIAGNPRALDLTATRRLGLAAERHGVPLFLVRHDATADLSSARMRWRVRSAVSPAPRWNAAAPKAGPGMGSWHAELFRSRAHAPGEWILHDDGHALIAERPATTVAPDVGQGTTAPDHGDLAGPAGAGSLAAG